MSGVVFVLLPDVLRQREAVASALQGGICEG